MTQFKAPPDWEGGAVMTWRHVAIVRNHTPVQVAIDTTRLPANAKRTVTIGVRYHDGSWSEIVDREWCIMEVGGFRDSDVLGWQPLASAPEWRGT